MYVAISYINMATTINGITVYIHYSMTA